MSALPIGSGHRLSLATIRCHDRIRSVPFGTNELIQVVTDDE